MPLTDRHRRPRSSDSTLLTAAPKVPDEPATEIDLPPQPPKAECVLWKIKIAESLVTIVVLVLLAITLLSIILT